VTAFELENLEIEGWGDMAYIYGQCKMTLAPEGMEPSQDHGKYLEIRQRQPGGTWLLYRDMFNSDVELQK
jgi:ketosteroid isomerase-like protein